MDLNGLWQEIPTALVTLIAVVTVMVKTIVPRIVESRVKEREARTMEKAEQAAYERNRQTTREDKTFEILYDAIEFIQERITKDNEYRERQLEEFAKLVESVRGLDLKYQIMAGNQTTTNQTLAVMTDELRGLKVAINEGGTRERNGRDD